MSHPHEPSPASSGHHGSRELPSSGAPTASVWTRTRTRLSRRFSPLLGPPSPRCPLLPSRSTLPSSLPSELTGCPSGSLVGSSSPSNLLMWRASTHPGATALHSRTFPRWASPGPPLRGRLLPSFRLRPRRHELPPKGLNSFATRGLEWLRQGHPTALSF